MCLSCLLAACIEIAKILKITLVIIDAFIGFKYCLRIGAHYE